MPQSVNVGPTVAVVTGAGRGMGHACAGRLAATVDALVLVDRDAGSLESALHDMVGGRAAIEAMTVDVTDASALTQVAQRIAALGTLRHVVHAAGISPTMADWRSILTVDLAGTAQLVDALRPLVAAGTAMVCFASMAAQILLRSGDPKGDAVLDSPLDAGLPDRLRAAVGASVEDPALAYAWAKRGVQRLVQREAVRWGPLGGRICSVSPGMIDTPQGRQEFDHQPAMSELLKLTPVGRIGEAVDVAAVVAFLLSDEAAFMTGCDVLVDGGVVAALAHPPPPS